MKRVLFIMVALSLYACNQSETDIVLPYVFEDGFESTDNDLDDLLPRDNSRWTGIQKVSPNNGDNIIQLNTTLFSEGSNSLRIVSKPSDDVLSKIDIEKKGFFAPVGHTISIEASFFINSAENLKELFLIDLECCSCWDATVPDNQCPGIRLKMSGTDNYLSIERGKILGSTITQTQFPFPMNEWVKVNWEMKLSPNEEGENRLLINGQEVINELGKNMPNADEFRQEFATYGIDFELQSPLGYESIQIGATANPTVHEVELLIDDFKLTIE